MWKNNFLYRGFQALNHKIESFLYKKNFKDKKIRKIMGSAFMLSLCLLVLSVLGSWFFWLFVGVFLATWQFYALAYGVQKKFLVNPNKAFIFIQLILAQLRLLVSAFIIYKLVSSLQADLGALLIGISLIPVLISFYVLSERLRNKSMEA